MANASGFFKDFKVGDSAEFSEIISENMVKEFAEFSKDKNPLHTDPKYAEQTAFKGTVAHGMIAAALFSRLMGMHLPGKYCLYLKQSLNFHKPIYPNTPVKVLGIIIHKTDSLNLLNISTKVLDNLTQEVYVDGEALVKVLK